MRLLLALVLFFPLMLCAKQPPCSDFNSCKTLAEKINIVAQYNKGVSYDRGLGVEKNYNKAKYWFGLAAQKGLPAAQYNLGILSEEENDFKDAFKWYRKSAYQGDVDAQHNLSVLYVAGHGVPQDLEKSFYWMEKAAKQGNPDAQSVLGYKYYQGVGVNVDLTRAYAWLNIAIANGCKNSAVESKFRNNIFEMLSKNQKQQAVKLSKKYWKKYGAFS